MGLLDALIYGVRDILADLTPVARRSRLAFKGAGVTVTEDPTNDRTLVTIPGPDATLPTVLTADATPVYVVLATPALGASAEIDVLVRVSKADGTLRQSFKLSGLFYVAAGPLATLDGGSLTDSGARGTGTADARFDISGASVRLKLTGVAATALAFTYDVSVV